MAQPTLGTAAVAALGFTAPPARRIVSA